MTFCVISAAMLAATPIGAAAEPAAMLREPDAALAAHAISSGRDSEAIAALEEQREASPNDPAVLINLGIAHAHQGNDEQARAMFKAAMASRETVELETANGRAIDSKRLARNALSMLERGEFRKADQLTLND